MRGERCAELRRPTRARLMAEGIIGQPIVYQEPFGWGHGMRWERLDAYQSVVADITMDILDFEMPDGPDGDRRP